MHKYKNIIYFFLFIFLVLLDQISKYIIRLSGGFYICNENLAFGLNPNKTFFILFCIFLFFIIYNLKFKIINFKSISNFKFQILNWKTLKKLATILILSGGISNIIDRIYYSCVIDFIDLKFWPASNAISPPASLYETFQAGVAIAGWPVFNFADIYITIGVILFLKIIYFKK